jgi:hypothetical protein
MSKKHFIALADTLRASKPTNPQSQHFEEYLYQWQRDVEHIADFCRSQNSAFMRGRWMDYINGECGPNGGKVVSQ